MITAKSCADARINLSRLASLLFVVALCLTDSRWSLNQPIIGQLLGFIGWLLVGVGVMGRIWAGSYICGCKNITLMMQGPYSLCRNPLYLFSFIGGVGALLVTQTLTFPLAFAAVFLSYYHPVMRNEEQTLRGIHGASFEAYRKAVPLFWPKRWQLNEPENYAMSSRQFRRFLVEVVWFIVIAALVQLLHHLHVSGMLPTVVSLY
ncbi:MAG: isoprenylcysteine carboxylmethyltransferase family protein [Steroidobacteraceae bacterium]